MTKEQIFESEFITAFIDEYFEEKRHGFYPDKDRLLYVFCENEAEKIEVTKEQIKKVKAEISKLGFEELSFAYLMSCKSDEPYSFIEPNKRFDYWLKQFSEDVEFHSDFHSSILNEIDSLSLIESDIKDYSENGRWEFDFEEYEKLIDVSEPIEILFTISELFVQLNRLEIFNDLLDEVTTPTQPIVSETAKYSAKHYVLTYIIECHAKGESLPLGRKKELEQIGNERIGRGKGNRFYKVFNDTINKDLNNEEHLIEIGGIDWRNAVIALSSKPEIIEQYLQSKQL